MIRLDILTQVHNQEPYFIAIGLKQASYWQITNDIHLDLQQATGLNYQQKVQAYLLALIQLTLNLQQSLIFPAPAASLKELKSRQLERYDDLFCIKIGKIIWKLEK